MKVKELIAILNKFPETYDVVSVVANSGEGFYTSEEPIKKQDIENEDEKVIIYCSWFFQFRILEYS